MWSAELRGSECSIPLVCTNSEGTIEDISQAIIKAINEANGKAHTEANYEAIIGKSFSEAIIKAIDEAISYCSRMMRVISLVTHDFSSYIPIWRFIL